jgi:N-acetylmuramoyl-L-alanine amidase
VAVIPRAVLVLLLALLAGCGTTPPPPTTAAPSRAPTQAPSPAPGAPVVVLDPGHNGGNAGAADEIAREVPDGRGGTKPCNTTGTATSGRGTSAGYAEHAFAFDVSQRAAAVLRSAGVTVLLTRTDDVGVGPCVDARAAAANDVDADVAVSVHADGAAVDARGFHVIEPDVAPDGGNAAIVPASHEAAAMLRTAFAAVTGLGLVRCVT